MYWKTDGKVDKQQILESTFYREGSRLNKVGWINDSHYIIEKEKEKEKEKKKKKQKQKQKEKQEQKDKDKDNLLNLLIFSTMIWANFVIEQLQLKETGIGLSATWASSLVT